MSSIGHKRERDGDCKIAPPAKKLKIGHILKIKQAIWQMCNNYNRINGWRCRHRTSASLGDYSVCDFANHFNSLLTTSLSERKQLIEPFKCNCNRIYYGLNAIATCDGCRYYVLLSQIVDGTSFEFLSKFFDGGESIDLSELNMMKLNIIRNVSKPLIISHGESHRTPILTVELNTKPTAAYGRVGSYYGIERRKYMPYTMKYYKGAIQSLEHFTAEIFLNSVKDFDFFRFIKRTANNAGKDVYIDCSDEEVLNLLQSLKTNKYYDLKNAQTFLLLTFLMVAYYRHFIVNAIKAAVQNISGIDNDTLSEISSFMLTYHSSFHEFFEDKQFIKLLLLEANNASADWQDILVDIIENDEEYKELYEPNMRIYYESEKLNLLNIRLNNKTLSVEKFSNWLANAVGNDHYEIFNKLVMEHCRNRMSSFKQMFWYSAPFNEIAAKPDSARWIKVVENKVHSFSLVLNKTQCKKLEQLHFDWKSKTVIKKRKYRPRT